MSDFDGEAKKQCGACLEWKPLNSFHRFRDGRQSYCKPCRKAWDAAYWERNREYRIAKQKERRREIRDWLRGIKSSTPCPDCGGTFHWAAMTYDHLPGSTKRGNVSDLVKGGYRGVLLAEIAKCDLVCSNCHAVRTYLRSLGIEPTQPSICEPSAVYAISTAPLN